MLKKTGLFALVLASLLVMPAQAAFISTDWTNSGDKLSTLDTDTGLEWLDLSVTKNKSIAEVKTLLTTTYLGWRMPTFDEIHAMAVKLFPVIGTVTATNKDAQLANDYPGGDRTSFALFGAPVNPYTYGMYEKDGKTYLFGAHTPGNTLYFNYRYSNDLNWKRVYEGVFLVNDGGVTLSSIQDPALNINNPNAPINNQPEPEATPVSAPVGFAALGVLLMLMSSRKRMTT